MYIYVCVCVCVFNAYKHLRTNDYNNQYIRTYIHRHNHNNEYLHTHIQTYLWIHTYIHTHKHKHTHTHTRADIHNLHACVSTNTQFQHFITDKTQSQVNVPCFQGMHESDMSETRTLSECFHFEIAGYI